MEFAFLTSLAGMIFSQAGLIALLFVCLFVWVLKTTEKREARLEGQIKEHHEVNMDMRDAIDKIIDTNQMLVTQFTEKMSKVETKVNHIEGKVDIINIKLDSKK